MNWLDAGLRLLGLKVPEPMVMDLGADFASDEAGVRPPYDPTNALGAAKVFSWIYAAAHRRGLSLARLPQRVYRVRGGRRELLNDHWFHRLLSRPNTLYRRTAFLRDLEVDYCLGGNVIVPVLGPASPRGTITPISLLRWHPARVSVRSSRQGPTGYALDVGDNEIIYPAGRVLHLRGVTVDDDPAGQYWGVGAIQPLHHELEAEHQAVLRARESLKRGRPDGVIHPKGGRQWTREQREAVSARYEALTRAQGGWIVAPEEVGLQNFSWSPRDLESPAIRQGIREGVLAVMRTPPVTMGLETANFATAREQDSQYWASIEEDAILFDECLWTPLVAELAGEADLVVETDCSGVRALQQWRSDAIQQATSLYFLGISRDIALETVGLGDVAEAQQVVDGAAVQAAKPPPTKDSPATDTDTDTDTADIVVPKRSILIPRLLTRDDLWWRGVSLGQRASTDRDILWRSHIERLHEPATRRMGIAVGNVLRTQAARLAARLDAAMSPERALRTLDVSQIMASIWDELAEQAGLRTAMEGPAEEAARQAWIDMLSQLRLAETEVDWDPGRPGRQATQDLASSIQDISATTRAGIQSILETGLESGQTVAQMQSEIQQAHLFGPVRALAIARTETTRELSTGQLDGLRTSAEVVEDLAKEWMAERDDATRAEHWVLDGSVVEINADFTIPATGNGRTARPQFVGQAAQAPGRFALAALVVSCRCGLTPAFKEQK